MIRPLRAGAIAVLLASPTMPGAIQAAAFAQSQPEATAPAAAQTTPAAPATAVPPVAPQPPAAWPRATAEELLRYVDAIGAEGLDPADYDADGLRAALAGSDAAALATVANQIFLKLAADLSGGSVRGTGRVDWHMPDAG